MLHMHLVALTLLCGASTALLAPPRVGVVQRRSVRVPAPLRALPDVESEELFGGFTAKQRIREEIDSPFRKIRLYFFGASTVSAVIALYFSLIGVAKASAGGFADAPPMATALENVGVNVAAVVGCALITRSDLAATQKALERIAQGGRLAKLVVSPADAPAARTALAEYRRTARVVIAVGGEAYVKALAAGVAADAALPSRIAEVDAVVVPVLLKDARGGIGDASGVWGGAAPAADGVVCFPRGAEAWAEYLDPELATMKAQGFDVVEKGFTLVVKKNGKILRRSTGPPPWPSLLGTMEVADGSAFGMPGDSEKYKGI